MEIITYVRSGAITHEDSMGNKGRTGAGDVQVMSAGTGVRHAEYNLEDEATTLFQIWVQTDRPGARARAGAPSPSQSSDRAGRFVTLASGFAEDEDALRINAAARVMGATLKAGEKAELSSIPPATPISWRRTAPIEVNGVRAEPRDGVAITGEQKVEIAAVGDAEIVLVDAR